MNKMPLERHCRRSEGQSEPPQKSVW